MAHAAPVVRRPTPQGVPAVLLAVVVGVAALAGGPVLAVAVLAVQLAGAAGVLLLMDVPSFRDSMAIATVTAVGADALALRDEGADVGAVTGVLALAFVAAVLAELARRDRERVAESMAATVAAATFVVLAAHLLVLHAPRDGDHVVAVAVWCLSISLVVGRVVDLVAPTPRAAPGGTRGAAGIAAAVASGGLSGAALGAALAPLTPRSGAVLGLAVAAAGAAADVATDLAAADLVSRRTLSAPLTAALPVVLTAPVAYGVARLLIG